MGGRGRRAGDDGHRAPCYGELDPLPPAAPAPLPPLEGHSGGSRDSRRAASSRRPKKERGGEARQGSTVAHASPDAHPEMASVGPGGGVDCLPRGPEAGSEKTRGPQRGVGQALRGQGSQSRALPPLAPRCPRLPRAGDAQALPVDQAAAPAKDGLTVSPHDPPPTAVLPERPQ